MRALVRTSDPCSELTRHCPVLSADKGDYAGHPVTYPGTWIRNSHGIDCTFASSAGQNAELPFTAKLLPLDHIGYLFRPARSRATAWSHLLVALMLARAVKIKPIPAAVVSPIAIARTIESTTTITSKRSPPQL